MEEIRSKEALVEKLKCQIKGIDRVAINALIKVYNNQSESEKACGGVIENNGIGFMYTDSKILSSMAEWYLNRGYLSAKQLEIVKNKMVKYARQIIEGSIREGKIRKEKGRYIW